MARDYNKDVQTIIDTQWNTSKGTSVPTSENIALAGGAKIIDATFLYADLANSSKMVKEFDRRVAAKIIKSFLQSCTNLVKQNNGTVISFDGDRILGVFMGGQKNTNAAKCALQINYVVTRVIKPKFENKYTTVRDANFNIRHGVGIDTGEVLVVRGGVRGNNDLISIARAPNLASKLSGLRKSPYHTIITYSVYNMLLDSSRYGGSDNQNMWTKDSWSFLNENHSIYKSNWHWKV